MKFLYSILIAALFVACNNAPEQNTNEQVVDHSEIEAISKPDTAAIKPGQKVFFENIIEGQVIKLPFVVKFGVEGMVVEPAQGVNEDKGHHHLFIDQTYIPASTMVPMGKEADGYYHFGKGQLSDTLNLSKYPMLTPGIHTLRLQFANGLHMSYGSAMSSQVRVEIQ